MKSSRLSAIATVSLLALSAPAFAQEAATSEPAQVAEESNEIVITARRREESLQDVPLVVQAVTGQQLQKLEVRQFEDVTKLVPGLALSKTGASTSASIRGINFDARASGASTSVEFYRNDAVISAGALFQAVYDIGQVEVLRGPQGTLRGRASPSGSITVTTRRPDLNEIGGYMSGTVSDSHAWNLNGALNVPVVEGKVGARLAWFVGKDRGNDIFGLNVPIGAIDSDIFDKTRAIRASLRVDPLDGVLVFDFSYEAIQQRARQYQQVESFNQFLSTAAASPRTVAASDRLGVGALAGTDHRKIRLLNGQATLRQFGQRLTYVGSRTNIAQFFLVPNDLGGLFSTQSSLIPPTPAVAPISVFAQLTNSHVKQTTHEIRLQNEDRIAGLFDYVVGAFRVKGNSPTILTVPNPPSTTAVGVSPTLYTLNSFSYRGTLRFRADEENSLFGNVTLHLGDRTELSGGLRRIWFKADSGVRSSTDLVTFTDVPSVRRCFGNPDVPGCLPTKKATIYNASVKHNFTDDLMAYASYGTSWRPGNSLVGYQGAADVGPFLNQFLNLPDETSKSYEIGIKTAWLDRRLKFNISAYYQKFSNYPFFNTTPVRTVNSAGTVLVNAFNFVAPVAAKIKGIEADLSFDIRPNFFVGATLAYANGKISNGLFPCVDLNDDNIQDAAKPTAAQLFAEVGTNQIDTCVANASSSSQPRWSGTIQAEYSHPVSGWGEAFLRGFASWKGNSQGDSINPNDGFDAFALVDLFAGVRDPDGAWELSIFAKNLFDTHRVLTRSASPLTTPISSTAAATYNYLGITTTDPREFGVSLRIGFGSR